MGARYECSKCGHRFSSEIGTLQHIHDYHKGRGSAQVYAPAVEESLGERTVQAEHDRACGIPNPDIELLLP